MYTSDKIIKKKEILEKDIENLTQEFQKLKAEIKRDQRLWEEEEQRGKQAEKKKLEAEKHRRYELGTLLEQAYGASVPYSVQKKIESESFQKLLYQVLQAEDPQIISEQLELGQMLKSLLDSWLDGWKQENSFEEEEKPSESDLLPWLKKKSAAEFFTNALDRAWEAKVARGMKVSGFKEVYYQLQAGDVLEDCCGKYFYKEDLEWMKSDLGSALLQKFCDRFWLK